MSVDTTVMTTGVEVSSLPKVFLGTSGGGEDWDVGREIFILNKQLAQPCHPHLSRQATVA